MAKILENMISKLWSLDFRTGYELIEQNLYSNSVIVVAWFINCFRWLGYPHCCCLVLCFYVETVYLLLMSALLVLGLVICLGFNILLSLVLPMYCCICMGFYHAAECYLAWDSFEEILLPDLLLDVSSPGLIT